MTHIFAGMHYDSERDMCDAIAEYWLSADGANSRDKMRGILVNETDEMLANDCIRHWFSPWAPDEQTEPNFEREQLVRAFARLRRDIDNRFP